MYSIIDNIILAFARPLFLLNKLLYLLQSFFPKKLYILNWPRAISLYSTNKCNLNCSWCLRENFSQVKKKDLDLIEFKKILHYLPTVSYVYFAGLGEPLLNKNMFELIDYASQKHIRISIITNAIPLNKSIINVLLKKNISEITCSLKGNSEKDFIETTRSDPQLFHVQLRNIRHLVNIRDRHTHKMKITLSYVIHKRNYKNMNSVIMLGEELGVDTVKFDALIPFRDKKMHTLCLYENNERIVKEVRRITSRLFKVKVIPPVLLKKVNYNYYCKSLSEVITIDQEGNTSGGCMRIIAPSNIHPNIFSFKKNTNIFNCSEFLLLRRKILQKKLPTYCKYCPEQSCP